MDLHLLEQLFSLPAVGVWMNHPLKLKNRQDQTLRGRWEPFREVCTKYILTKAFRFHKPWSVHVLDQNSQSKGIGVEKAMFDQMVEEWKHPSFDGIPMFLTEGTDYCWPNPDFKRWCQYLPIQPDLYVCIPDATTETVPENEIMLVEILEEQTDVIEKLGKEDNYYNVVDVKTGIAFSCFEENLIRFMEWEYFQNGIVPWSSTKKYSRELEFEQKFFPFFAAGVMLFRSMISTLSQNGDDIRLSGFRLPDHVLHMLIHNKNPPLSVLLSGYAQTGVPAGTMDMLRSLSSDSWTDQTLQILDILDIENLAIFPPKVALTNFLTNKLITPELQWFVQGYHLLLTPKLGLQLCSVPSYGKDVFTFFQNHPEIFSSFDTNSPDLAHQIDSSRPGRWQSLPSGTAAVNPQHRRPLETEQREFTVLHAAPPVSCIMIFEEKDWQVLQTSANMFVIKHPEHFHPKHYQGTVKNAFLLCDNTLLLLRSLGMNKLELVLVSPDGKNDLSPSAQVDLQPTGHKIDHDFLVPVYSDVYTNLFISNNDLPTYTPNCTPIVNGFRRKLFRYDAQTKVIQCIEKESKKFHPVPESECRLICFGKDIAAMIYNKKIVVIQNTTNHDGITSFSTYVFYPQVDQGENFERYFSNTVMKLGMITDQHSTFPASAASESSRSLQNRKYLISLTGYSALFNMDVMFQLCLNGEEFWVHHSSPVHNIGSVYMSAIDRHYQVTYFTTAFKFNLFEQHNSNEIVETKFSIEHNDILSFNGATVTFFNKPNNVLMTHAVTKYNYTGHFNHPSVVAIPLIPQGPHGTNQISIVLYGSHLVVYTKSDENKMYALNTCTGQVVYQKKSTSEFQLCISGPSEINPDEWRKCVFLDQTPSSITINHSNYVKILFKVVRYISVQPALPIHENMTLEDIRKVQLPVSDKQYQRNLILLHQFWTGNKTFIPRAQYNIDFCPFENKETSVPTSHTCIKLLVIPNYPSVFHLVQGIRIALDERNWDFRFV